MATLSRGKTFTVNEEVTNTKLHQLIDSGAISGIVSADHDLTTTNPVHVGAAAPSSSDQKVWLDTSNDVFRVKDSGGTWQPINGHAYTNKSAVTLAQGDVVIIDTSNDSAVTTTTTANDTSVFGVVFIGGAVDATIFVITEGYAPVINVTGSTNNGDYLATSTTVKKADPSTSFGTGTFARAMTTSATAVEGVVGGATLVAAVSGAKFTSVNATTSTRSTTAITGTVNYAHGLSVTPTNVTVKARVDGLNAYFSTGECFIAGTSSFSNACVYQDKGGTDLITDNDACVGFATNEGSNYVTGKITAVDGTNVTISWTLTGTNDAHTMDLVFNFAG